MRNLPHICVQGYRVVLLLAAFSSRWPHTAMRMPLRPW